MDSTEQEMARLRAQIAEKELLLADLESELLDLRRDLNQFKARYERRVKPIATRLEAVQAAIVELEEAHNRYLKEEYFVYTPPLQSEWQPPPDYVPVEEQYRRTWKAPQQEERAPEPQAKPRLGTLGDRESRIKRLYRQLARRYHPDLAADPADRASRNELMARINEAYTRRDIEALEALAARPVAGDAREPLTSLRLRELHLINDQLAQRIGALKLERANLMHSDMMRLALEEKLARSRGRDLLAEIAAGMEREYQACLVRLEQLRSQRRR